MEFSYVLASKATIRINCCCNFADISSQGGIMGDWTEGDVCVRGVNLHYYRTGGEKPPLILLHGVTDNGKCWTPVAEILSERYDVIMPDAYGHGLSARIDEKIPKQSHGDHLFGLIDTLGIQKPLLMGHSMGAGTAAGMASQYPDLPRAIILEDPPWRDTKLDVSPEEIAANKRRSQMFSRWTGILQQKSREELISHCRKNNPAWPESELTPWAESKLQFDTSFYTAMRSTNATYQDIASKIHCPALLISGDPVLGGIITPEVAENVCRIWRNSNRSRWVRIEGAGHSIRREQFETFRNVLCEFLDEIG